MNQGLKGARRMKTTRYFGVALAAVVLCGIVLREYRLEKTGITVGDEATYYLTARSLSAIGSWAWGQRAALAAGTATAADLEAHLAAAGVEFRLPYYSKPLFDLLAVGALAVWDGRPQGMMHLNVIFSGIAMVFIGLLGRRLYGPGTGLCAAALFAVSAASLSWSRMALAHIPAVALLLAGGFFYTRARFGTNRSPAGLWQAGVCWGAGLAIHPNILPYIGLLFLIDGLGGLQRGLTDIGRSWVKLGAGMVAVIAVIQGATLAAGKYLGAVLAGQAMPYRTYFEQIALHVRAVVDGDIGLVQKVYTYFFVLWAHEGAVVMLLLCGSTWWVWRRGWKADPVLSALLVLLWVPMAYFVFSRNQAVFRYESGIVAVFPLICARGLQLLAGAAMMPRRVRPWGGVALACLAVCFSAYNARPVFAAQSAWKVASAWVDANGDKDEVVMARHIRLWTVNGGRADRLDSRIGQGGYIAFYRRYLESYEHELMGRLGAAEPCYAVRHRRYGKLMEEQFLRGSWLVRGAEAVPVLGPKIASGRARALHLNDQRVLEIYDLDATPDPRSIAWQGDEDLAKGTRKSHAE